MVDCYYEGVTRNSFQIILSFSFKVGFVLESNADPDEMLHIVQAPYESAELKINFLFLNQNICCGYSKEPSQ